MPIELTADFETGSNGANLALTDRGSHQVFESIAGTTVPKYDTAHVKYGTLAAKMDCTGANQSAFGWGAALNGIRDITGRFYLYMAAYPTGGSYDLVRISTGVGRAYVLRVGTDGKLEIFGDGASLAISTNVCNLNAWTRLEFYWRAGLTAGAAIGRLHTDPDSLTLTEQIGVDPTAAGGNNPSTALTAGETTSGAGAGVFWIDQFAAVESPGVWLGPYVPSLDPRQYLDLSDHPNRKIRRAALRPG